MNTIISIEDEKVAYLSKALGKQLGFNKNSMLTIGFAGKYHDIGKLLLPLTVLEKPDKLTKEEYELVKTHTKLGADIFDVATNKLANNRLACETCLVAKEVAMYHHENYDGSGYYGCDKTNTSMVVQIIHLVDVYVALISKRAYKKAWTQEEALEFLQENSGKMFNPILVDIFTKMMLSLAVLEKSKILKSGYLLCENVV